MTTSTTGDRVHHREGRVVLAGSMSSLAAMQELAAALAKWGIEAVVPSPDDDPGASTIEAMDKIKRDASKAHMASICDERTTALLVANVDRHGTPNYVGPNAFGEIAVAFAAGRHIYLLQAMPDQYASELRAWDARCLHGDIARFVDDLRQRHAYEFVGDRRCCPHPRGGRAAETLAEGHL